MSLSAPSFEDAFSALIRYLKQSAEPRDFISIPDHIEKPFRSASCPADSSQLRELLKIFKGKPLHVLQLAPKSFCGILFIVLHFAHSFAQDKLLHAFMNATTIYQDDQNALSAFRKFGIQNVTKTLVQDFRGFIFERLLHTLLRRLVGGHTEKETRWTVAQFLVLLARTAKKVRTRLLSFPECKHLSTLLQDLTNCVGRILVADLLRELIYHGANGAQFWPDGTEEQIILSFPIEVNSSAAWLAKLQRFFADIDTSIAFNERQSMLTVEEVIRSSGTTDWATQHAIAVISKDFTFVSSNENDQLHVFTLPIYAPSGMNIAFRDGERRDDAVLSISYLVRNGWEVSNGSKRTVNSMTVRFESSLDAQRAEIMVMDAQKQIFAGADTVRIQDTEVHDITQSPKRSIALVDLWSPRDDCLLPTEETSLSLPIEGSETEEASPLRHRSQDLSQTRRDALQSGHSSQGWNSETGCETSFLEAAQDQKSLQERLRASKENKTTGDEPNECYSRDNNVIIAIQKALPIPKKSAAARPANGEGTMSTRTHLPSKARQSQGKLRSPHNGTLEKCKTRTNDKANVDAPATQRTALVGTVTIDPEPPSSGPAAVSEVKNNGAPDLAPPPPAIATVTKPKKAPGGPMARLVGAQSQGKQKSVKQDSQPTTSLKRKKATPNKAKVGQNVDWDKDLQDESQFDLPDEVEDNTPPIKKTKTAAKQTNLKTTSKSSTTTRKKPDVSKKHPSKPHLTNKAKAANTTKSTAASTRTRRAAVNPTTYEEDSGTDEVQVKGGISPSDVLPNDGSKLSLSVKNVELKPRRKSEATEVPHSGGHTVDINGSASTTKPKRQKDMETQLISGDQHPKSNAEAKLAGETDSGLANTIDVDAQDSYPMDKADRDAAVVEADASFGTQLHTQLQASRQNITANAKSVPPTPKTALGDPNQFITTINAARSVSPKKISMPGLARPHAKAKSSERSEDAVPSLNVPHFEDDDAPVSEKGRHTNTDELGDNTVQDEEIQEPLQDEDDSRNEKKAGRDPISLNQRRLHHTAADVAFDSSNEIGSIDIATTKDEVIASMTISKNSMIINSYVPTTEQGQNQHSTKASSIEKTSHGDRLDYNEPSPGTHEDETRSQRRATLETGVKAHIQSLRGVDVQGTNASEPKAIIDTQRLGSSKSSIKSPEDTLGASHPARTAKDSNTTLHASTPARDLKDLMEGLHNKEISNRTPIVAFGPDGPKNQGVRKNAITVRQPENGLSTPETVRHDKAKMQGGEKQVTTTPIRKAGASFARPISISDDEHSEVADEGISIQADGEIDAGATSLTRSKAIREGAQPPVGDAPAAQGPAQENQSHTSSSRLVEPTSEDTQQLQAHDDTSAGHSSYAEAVNVEHSEYYEESESVDEPQEIDDTEAPETHSKARGPNASVALRMGSPSRPRRAAANALTDESVHASRQSIGLGSVVSDIHKKAPQVITTDPFRLAKRQTKPKTFFNPTTIVGVAAPGTNANLQVKRDIQGTASMLPPQPKPAPNTEKAVSFKSPRATFKLPAVEKGVNVVLKDSWNANPLAASRPPPSISETAHYPELAQSVNANHRPRGSEVQLGRDRKMRDEAGAALSFGTPVPFHTKLSDMALGIDGSNAHEAESYVYGDAGDITLVNKTSKVGHTQRKTGTRSRFEGGMTETTEDSFNPDCGAEDVWRNIRGAHQDLFQNLMQIADDVLFRLGEEEDAIRAKATDFQRGATILQHGLAKSWDECLSHETGRIANNLKHVTQNMADFMNVAEKQGLEQWQNLRGVEQIQTTAATRRDELLSRIEALMAL